MACALAIADEVARNGALQRITSARGFLERPLHIFKIPRRIRGSSRGVISATFKPASAFPSQRYLLGARAERRRLA